MRIRRHRERRLGFSNVWYNIDVPLYLEQEVRIDEGKGRQLAAGAGVVARPGLVARAGDRRLLTGEASLVRIFLLPIIRATLSGANRINHRDPDYFYAVG